MTSPDAIWTHLTVEHTDLEGGVDTFLECTLHVLPPIIFFFVEVFVSFCLRWTAFPACPVSVGATASQFELKTKSKIKILQNSTIARIASLGLSVSVRTFANGG